MKLKEPSCPVKADYNDGWDAFINDDFKTAIDKLATCCRG